MVVLCACLVLLIGMARARNLLPQVSVDISDEEAMVPTEVADRDASRSPPRGLLAAGSAVAPRLTGSAAPSGVLSPGGDGDILATLRSLVAATNASREESRRIVDKIDEQGRRLDAFAGMLQDYETRAKSVEDRCRSLEIKVAELSRAVAEKRSASASPCVGAPDDKKEEAEADPLMVALSWAEPLERKVADTALRGVLGLDDSYALIFPRKYATLALLRTKSAAEVSTILDASRDGSLKVGSQRLWARRSQSKLQQRSSFLLRKAVAFLVSKGCETVEKDSSVVYVNGRPALSVRGGQIKQAKAWPVAMAGSFEGMLEESKKWG